MKARKRWAHVQRMSTGQWDFVIYSRVHGALCCSGTVGMYASWRLAFDAAYTHLVATGGTR